MDTGDKLQEMEELIRKQKEIITQQKNVIENQTEKIEELETSVRNITHEVGSFEEIDWIQKIWSYINLWKTNIFQQRNKTSWADLYQALIIFC